MAQAAESIHGLLLVKVYQTLDNCEVVKKNFELSKEKISYEHLCNIIRSGFSLDAKEDLFIQLYPDETETINADSFRMLMKSLGNERSIKLRLITSPTNDQYAGHVHACQQCSRVLDPEAIKFFCITCYSNTLCEKCQVNAHDDHEVIRVKAHKQIEELVHQLNDLCTNVLRNTHQPPADELDDEETMRLKRRFPDYAILREEQKEALRDLYIEMQIDDETIFKWVRITKLKKKSEIIRFALSDQI